MSETPERLALRKTYMSHAVTSGPLMGHPDYVHYVRADRIEELEAKLAKAVETLELADNNLTNLQPKIANGLVRSDWVPVFDGYIDPVIQAARAALTQKDTVHD